MLSPTKLISFNSTLILSLVYPSPPKTFYSFFKDILVNPQRTALSKDTIFPIVNSPHLILISKLID